MSTKGNNRESWRPEGRATTISKTVQTNPNLCDESNDKVRPKPSERRVNGHEGGPCTEEGPRSEGGWGDGISQPLNDALSTMNDRVLITIGG